MIDTDMGRSPGAANLQGLSPLERVLRLFSDVRSGEGATGVLMLMNVLLILGAYYLLKPAREGLLATANIQSLSKIELKAYTSFGQSLLLLIVIPLYARLANRIQRRQLVTVVTLIFISNLVLFWVLQPGLMFARVPYLGIAFYLWVGIFNILVVAQFWSFAADIYTEERGKRLFPMIAIGASAGAVVGSWLTETLVSGGVGTYTLLLVAAGILLISIALTRAADQRGPTGGGAGKKTESPAEEPVDRSGSLSLVFKHRYLIAMAFMILFLNWVNTNGENSIYGAIQEAVDRQIVAQGITDPTAKDAFVANTTTLFYGNMTFWTNLVGLLMQAFLASRLLRFGGFGAILLMLPIISLTSYSMMALFPVLGIMKIMKIAENATDYSVNNTAKQVLWLPTTRNMKYKAKAAIDTIFVRFGDGFAALTVFVIINRLKLPVKSIFFLNIALVFAWILLALVILRIHRQLLAKKAAG